MTATITIATDETKPLVSPSASQDRNLCSGPSAVYQNLSKRHDWPVKIAIVDLPIRLKKKKSKRTSGNSLSPSRAQNKGLVASSQRLGKMLA